MIFSIRCSLQLHVIVRPDGVVSGGFIGLQLNGAGGVMRSEAPILETLRPIFGAYPIMGPVIFVDPHSSCTVKA